MPTACYNVAKGRALAQRWNYPTVVRVKIAVASSDAPVDADEEALRV